MQTLSRFDALINEFDRALKTLGAPQALQSRATPKAVHDALELSEEGARGHPPQINLTQYCAPAKSNIATSRYTSVKLHNQQMRANPKVPISH